ncbi:MAG: peptidoglycan-binding protein [Tistlia sp.]|uniref:peptidoglycan-binding protein n=1 Tax=Tistlia sp. TaxID=3057121 RepID=UPI0034A0FE07
MPAQLSAWPSRVERSQPIVESYRAPTREPRRGRARLAAFGLVGSAGLALAAVSLLPAGETVSPDPARPAVQPAVQPARQAAGSLQAALAVPTARPAEAAAAPATVPATVPAPRPATLAPAHPPQPETLGGWQVVELRLAESPAEAGAEVAGLRAAPSLDLPSPVDSPAPALAGLLVTGPILPDAGPAGRVPQAAASPRPASESLPLVTRAAAEAPPRAAEPGAHLALAVPAATPDLAPVRPAGSVAVPVEASPTTLVPAGPSEQLAAIPPPEASPAETFDSLAEAEALAGAPEAEAPPRKAAPTSSARADEGAPHRRLVAEVQRALHRQGLDPGPVDGLEGPRTSQAVRLYQQRSGLPEDGILDEALLQSLAAAEAPPRQNVPVGKSFGRGLADAVTGMLDALFGAPPDGQPRPAAGSADRPLSGGTTPRAAR